MRITILAMCLILSGCGGATNESATAPGIQSDPQTSSDFTDADGVEVASDVNTVENDSNSSTLDAVEQVDAVDAVEQVDEVEQVDAGESVDEVEQVDVEEPTDADEPADTAEPIETVVSADNDSEQTDSTNTTGGASAESLPAFTNLVTGQPVALTRAVWRAEDFENNPVTCNWFEFDGTNYIVVPETTTILVEHSPLSESGRGGFSLRFQGRVTPLLNLPGWSVVDGVYSGLTYFERPWLEVLDQNNGVNNTSTLRFWIFDSHHLECRALNPEKVFKPTGLQTTGNAVVVNDIDPIAESSDFIFGDFVAGNGDAIWEFCGTGRRDTLSQNQTFGTFPDLFGGFVTRHCVRRCSDAATELLDIPGWGFDVNANAECIFDVTGSSQSTIVPVYDNSSNQPLEFEERFAFPLYEGDGFWQCAIEARNSNTDSFVAGGPALTFRLFSMAELPNGRTVSSNWFFDDRSQRRSLRIEAELDDGTPFSYDGFTQIDHNSLVVYKTSLERLNCTRLNLVEDESLPVNLSDFLQAPLVPADTLLSQTTQCRAIESLGRGEFSVGSSGVGFRSSGVGEDFEITPTFAFVDVFGFFIYRLTVPTLPFPGEEGVISRTFRFGQENIDGEVFDSSSIFDSPTGRFVTRIRFKDLGTHIMAERFKLSASSGSRIREFTYFTCNSIR